jgi:PhnB protein
MITPYLHFRGNCDAAFKYYEKHLGGKVDMLMRYADAPPDMPASPEHKNLVMHAHMTIGDAHIMGADAPPERYHKPAGFSVSLTVKDLGEAERKFKALSQGGNETMPFGQTFFAKGFGMCTDQYGIPWMVNCPAEGM